MKCAVLIVLMALACVDSLPSEITTAKLSTTAASTPPSSRYTFNEELIKKQIRKIREKLKPGFKHEPAKETYEKDFIKIHEVGGTNFTNNIQNVTNINNLKDFAESRKINDDQILFNNFVKSTVEDLKSPNKTIKISSVHKIPIVESNYSKTANVSIILNSFNSSTSKPMVKIFSTTTKLDVINPAKIVNTTFSTVGAKIETTKLPFVVRVSESPKIINKTKTHKVSLSSTTAPKITNTIMSTNKLLNSEQVHKLRVNNKANVKRRPVHKNSKTTTTTPIPVRKVHTTSKRRVTNPTIKIKLTRSPTKRPLSFTTSKSIQSTTSRSTIKTQYKSTRRPTSSNSNSTEEALKQNWYEEGVPLPNPDPEINSYSPEFSLANVPNIVPEIPQDDVSSIGVDAVSESTNNLNPISTFSLDMLPQPGTKDSSGTTAGGSPCPTVHISSSVLGAQSRQECSDLNLVINSHYHQNSMTERTPSQFPGRPAEGTPQADAPVAEAPVAEAPVADTPVAGGSGGSGGGIPQAAAPSVPSGGTGGSGGSGGSGSDGNNNNGWQFPDLKHLFEAIGYIWNGLGHVLGFLKNPYLYIIPIVLFFLLGFLKVMALFPWWIPLLFIYLGIQRLKHEEKPKITYYKHHYPPKVVHHPDGWFWNHQTKTWQNLGEYLHHHHYHKHVQYADDRSSNETTTLTNGLEFIPDLIRKYADQYNREFDKVVKSWKGRKRRRRR